MNPNCPCTWECPRHGNCEACRGHHHPESRTACEKIRDREAAARAAAAPPQNKEK